MIERSVMAGREWLAYAFQNEGGNNRDERDHAQFVILSEGGNDRVEGSFDTNESASHPKILRLARTHSG